MNKAKVELDIFSGSENPKWEVDFDQALKWYQAAMRLPQTHASNRFEGLGYRGFILSLEEGGNRDIQCFVYADRIEIVKGITVAYKKDLDFQIETLLFESSKSRLDSQLYENVKRQIIRHK